MDIKHVVVLMLENRSFDSMLGQLYPPSDFFDGLTGIEQNTWHKTDGSPPEQVSVWTSPDMDAANACIPNPDPGELFKDIHMQIHGLAADGTLNPGPTMDGFVDNYVRQPPDESDPTRPFDPQAAMHYFAPNRVPVMTQLARAFGVSDRWHASAPCQTWPNRFFAHTATANGYVNNMPPHVPFTMETVFNRLDSVNQPWGVYFHDMPQSILLSRLWFDGLSHFHDFDEAFANDALKGDLPAYSFIEPRYFADLLGHNMPNDQHPPHDVRFGEALIARVYNAVRAGKNWKNTLLIVTYDEHGGCYDHVVPPAAASPDDKTPDGFDFGYFGVRVPAVIISPYIPAGSVIRPPEPGLTPFDHTSIIATLRALYDFAPLTRRDAAAPDLIGALFGDGSNDGPDSIPVPDTTATTTELAEAAARVPNGMQQGLSSAAMTLPTKGTDIDAHIAGLSATAPPVANHPSVGSAAMNIATQIKACLG